MATDDTSRQDAPDTDAAAILAEFEGAAECPSCGVQLLPDGSVDAIDDDPASARHYADCTTVGESQRG